MIFVNLDTQPPQMARGPVFCDIRTADPKPLVHQYFGDATHAGTGDPYKMYSLDAPHRVQV